MKQILSWFSGKKTYLVALAALIYGTGVTQGWWQHNVGLDIAFGALGVGTMRAAIAKVSGDAVPENIPATAGSVELPPEKGGTP